MIIRGPADSVPDLAIDAGQHKKRNSGSYARLAKEYHPEEHPKEFNQIQEAYQLLTGRGEGGKLVVRMRGGDWFSDGEKNGI